MAHEGTEPFYSPGLSQGWSGSGSGGSVPIYPGADFGSETEPGHLEVPARALSTRWVGWRMRMLVILVLLGCVGLFGLVRALSMTPRVEATWRLDPQGRIELASSRDPALHSKLGQTLVAVEGGSSTLPIADALLMQRSPRWLISDADRARKASLSDRFAGMAALPAVDLRFADGDAVRVALLPRGSDGLPMPFWLLAGFALALYLVGLVVLLARPSGRNAIYAAMALCQSANLLCIAVESVFVLGLPHALAPWDMPVRAGLDLCTAAAMVNAACLHPRRLPGGDWIAMGGWGLAIALITATFSGGLDHLWWWIQGSVIVYGLLAIGLLSWSYRIEPHPFAIVLRRFGAVTIGTWILLTGALAVVDQMPGMPRNMADISSMVWYLFLSSLLLLVPFLAKSEHFMREFSLLAAISTVATSLDLLFVAVFSLGQFASLTLSLFISLAVYSGVRQWILNQLLGNSIFTTERMFEQLYRIAREVEAHPDRTATLLSELLAELFEPLQVTPIDQACNRTRLASDASSMLVPVPHLGGETAENEAVLIRFAQRGRRLFTTEDARLTDRIVEQLRRAVHFDKAVEQGRREERLRLAQDLHDDIGARLLTLMYKSQSPEMEDYVRHTLQDLKTLTRGLAASNHRLSHAAAEWKSDLAHRLTAAHVALKWSFAFDEDILLTVVHWSALTRIMRELVSNVIAHSQAQSITIDFRLERDCLELTITDDGIGRNPREWTHGLGLGGVRKRVKQLGGEVTWREAQPRGISCRVVIRDLTAR